MVTEDLKLGKIKITRLSYTATEDIKKGDLVEFVDDEFIKKVNPYRICSNPIDMSFTSDSEANPFLCQRCKKVIKRS